MRGYRNTGIGLCYLIVCGWFAWLAPDQISDLGASLTGMGIGTTGVIFGRAYNKRAENGGG
jgi:hypothetical protein